MEDSKRSREERRQAFQSDMSAPARLPSERPLSPPPLRLARSPISSRNSVTSVKRMPMIREDDSPMLTSLGSRRPRPPRTGVFYQYGEDYITPWHLVGVSPSPDPRGASPRRGSVPVPVPVPVPRPRTSGASGEDLSDGEHDEKHGKHGVRDGGSWVARRGPLRRLCESRYWSWR